MYFSFLLSPALSRHLGLLKPFAKTCSQLSPCPLYFHATAGLENWVFNYFMFLLFSCDTIIVAVVELYQLCHLKSFGTHTHACALVYMNLSPQVRPNARARDST